MRKVIILRAAGNELANQLWNYVSIYAYTLERGYELENPSFFEYGMYFRIPTPSFFTKIFFFLPFENYTKRKTAFRRKVWRKLYVWYADLLARIHGDRLISYTHSENVPYYLPPTREAGSALQKLEHGSASIYFDGWLFRNPVGLERYRNEIKTYFKPREDIEQKVVEKLRTLRGQYRHIVGVHIRQGDYKVWRSGAYFIEEKRVRAIIDEYRERYSLNANEVCFLITSDGSIDPAVFTGLNTVISNNNAVTDLFLLAATDMILGSDSTFGAFAAYYGNIPFIVMQKGLLDWEYYRHQTTFFENKYSTMVHY